MPQCLGFSGIPNRKKRPRADRNVGVTGTKPMTAPSEFTQGQPLAEAVLARWLKACGRGTKVFSGCRLVGADRLQIGSYSQIDEGVWVFAGEGVSIGDHVHLAFGSSISGGGRCVLHDF